MCCYDRNIMNESYITKQKWYLFKVNHEYKKKTTFTWQKFQMVIKKSVSKSDLWTDRDHSMMVNSTSFFNIKSPRRNILSTD